MREWTWSLDGSGIGDRGTTKVCGGPGAGLVSVSGGSRVGGAVNDLGPGW